MSNGPHHLHTVAIQSGAAGRDIILPDIAAARERPREPVAIADMAEFFGVTHRTLHFYEEKDLIRASRIGLMRVYSERDVSRMTLINACREVGMPISVIQDLFETLSTASSKTEANLIFEEAMLARQRELAANLSMLHRQLQQINTLLTPEEDGGGTSAHVNRHRPELDDIEHRCLQLMAEGYSPLRIARTLELRSEEIEVIERQVAEKLGAQNRFQAVAKAVLLGIVAN
ncbi:MAG: MerR family transcriptional regulator [Rhizobium rhizophilum]|uniref:MerR family transcriptional regulator n=1 Tax=Rhizobium rhizophilum TaxID=1850373 RepID=UPI00391A5B01